MTRASSSASAGSSRCTGPLPGPTGVPSSGPTGMPSGSAGTPWRPAWPPPPPTGWSWEEVGSRNQAGHTRCAAYGLRRPGGRRLYVGSANGGLWEADLDGSGWTPLSDELFGGVDEVVALAPADLADPDVLLMRQGASLLRSDDGGATWTLPAGSELSSARTLALLPGGRPDGAAVRQHGWKQRPAGFHGPRPDVPGPQELALDLARGPLGPAGGAERGSAPVRLPGRERRSLDGGFTWASGGSPVSGSEGHLTGSEAGGGTTLYTVTRNGGSWVLHRSDDQGVTFSAPRSLPEYWGSQRSLCGFSADPTASSRAV